MFDITENDSFDGVQGKEKLKEKPRNITIEEKMELEGLIPQAKRNWLQF
jgi:hypothetical protein